MSSHVEMVKIGYWGGEGGQPRDRDQDRRPSRLVRVSIYSKREAINGISFEYVDITGERVSVQPWGGIRGCPATIIDLSTTEYLKEFSGTFGPLGNMSNIVTSLRFVTSENEEYESGIPTEEHFKIQLHQGRILGFFGRAGDFVDAIGIYCA